MRPRAAALVHLRAMLDAIPVHATPAQWQALADACSQARAYALGRVGVAAFTRCAAVGPGARPCVLAPHSKGRHVDARGKAFT